MASAIYFGTHPEISVTLPVPSPDRQVLEWPLRGPSAYNYVCAFVPGLKRPIPPIAAVWLAGVRRRSGPWFCVSITPDEWAQVRWQCPWVRKAKDMLKLTAPELAEAFLSAEMSNYEVVGDGGKTIFKRWA